MSLDLVSVKDEPEWEGVSEAAAREDLYVDHEVKEGLLLGSEVVQSPDMVYELRDGKVSVKMEVVTELPQLDNAGLSEPCWWRGVSARARSQLAMACSVRLERLRDDKAPHARHTSPRTSPRQPSVQAEHVTCKVKRDIPQKGDTYHCDDCGQQFKRKSNLIKHYKMNKHRNSYCNICNKQFSGYQSLYLHKRLHTGQKPHVCEICDKKFSRKDQLLRHIELHTERRRRPFVCEICPKTFSYRHNLVRHNLIHTGEKPYSCNVCHKQFRYSGNFVTHKRIHTGEKPFNCEFCNKRFVGGNDLSKHKRIHMGKTETHACTKCNRLFSRTDSLKRHYMRKHSGRKPYSCDVCDEKFARKSHVRVHKRIHA